MKIQYPFENTNLTFEERTRDLISRLTLEEKSGQVTNHMQAIPRLGIGSCKIGMEIARGMVCRDEKTFRKGFPTTILPQPYGMAAMFDEELMKKLGEVAGNEVRAAYNCGLDSASLFLYGPTVDMERDPRWGRNEEAYGEDPCLSARMNIAYTKGLAGEHERYWKTIPILKHFYANNYENERRTDNSNITVSLKQDYYLKVFRDIVKEGRAPGIMTAYNMINGVEGVNNPLVWEECKKTWGLKLAVSDGGDFNQNVTEHKTYQSHAESIGAILGKGADIMLEGQAMVQPAVIEAIQKGYLSEDNLNKAIGSAFYVRFMTGEFDPPEENPYLTLGETDISTPENFRLAELAGKESVILLKNDGLLPLERETTHTLAVVGPLSNQNYHCWYCGYAEKEIPIVEGLRNKVGADRVLWDEGFDRVAIRSKATGRYLSVKDDGVCVADAMSIQDSEIFELSDWDFGLWTLRSLKSGKYLTDTSEDMVMSFMDFSAEDVYGWNVHELLYAEDTGDGVILNSWKKSRIQINEDGRLISRQQSGLAEESLFEIEVLSKGSNRIAELAAQSDTVIVTVGNHPLIAAREEYDRPDIRLPLSQTRLLQAAAEENSRTLLYIVSGYPYSIAKEESLASAILFSTHIGPSLGTVAADILFGDYNPSGRCPTTWYHSVRELPAINDYDIMKNKTTYLYYQGKPLYSFGYGLSYTSFSYHDMEVAQTEEKLSVKLYVTNTGIYDGAEVVQLYISAPESVYNRPILELKDFRRVHIKAGASSVVCLDVDIDRLAFYNPDLGMPCVEQGEYEIMVGAASSDIRLRTRVEIGGVKIEGRCAERRRSALEADDYAFVQFLTDKRDWKEYFLAEDFRAYAIYHNLLMKRNTMFEGVFSTPAGEADITIINQRTGEILGQCMIPTTGSLSQFVSCVCPIKEVEGLTDIRIQFSKTTSMKEFRFF